MDLPADSYARFIYAGFLAADASERQQRRDLDTLSPIVQPF